MPSRRATITKNADVICCADLHIRPDTPAGRKDNYTIAIWRKVDFILDLSAQNGNCPILVAGDLGNKPGDRGEKGERIIENAWPPWLLETLINKFQGHNIIVIPGQHDLPNHRLDLWKRSGIGVLHAAGAITLLGPYDLENNLGFKNFSLYGFPYGINIIRPSFEKDIRTIAMAHISVIENKPRWPGDNAITGHSLLKQFPEYDLILTGDNHKPFVAEYKGRLLVNPGSMMRNTIDQKDHKPRVFLWYADENKVVPVFLPIEENVFDEKYIEAQQKSEAKDERFNTLITRVKQDVEIKLSFETNVQTYLDKFRTEKSVIDKIWVHIK